MYKPFIEKPFSSSKKGFWRFFVFMLFFIFSWGDHNVYLYYGKEKGYGSRRLFRKKKDQSSQAYPDVSNIRTNGSYIYEKFVPGGEDIKV